MKKVYYHTVIIKTYIDYYEKFHKKLKIYFNLIILQIYEQA